MSYETIPGTLAHRALAYLKTLPTGKWIASAPLAEAIGCRSDYLVSSLVTAVKHGLILREKRSGNVYWQAAAPGAVRAAVAPDRDEAPHHAEALDIDAIHRLAAKNNPFSSVAPAGEPPVPEPEKPAQAADPAPAPVVAPMLQTAAADETDRPWLVWDSDGRVTIMDGRHGVSLSPAQCGKLRRFLNHMQGFSLDS